MHPLGNKRNYWWPRLHRLQRQKNFLLGIFGFSFKYNISYLYSCSVFIGLVKNLLLYDCYKQNAILVTLEKKS